MVKRLRALASLAKDSGSIPTTHVTAYNLEAAVPEQLTDVFWLPRATGTHIVPRHACRQTLIYLKSKETHTPWGRGTCRNCGAREETKSFHYKHRCRRRIPGQYHRPDLQHCRIKPLQTKETHTHI